MHELSPMELYTKYLRVPAHVLGVCGPSPVSPGRLVLSVFVGMSDSTCASASRVLLISMHEPNYTCQPVVSSAILSRHGLATICALFALPAAAAT